MKTQHAWILYTALAGFVGSAGAAVQRESQEPQIIERGPYHRKWVNVVTSIDQDGRTVVKTNRYTELATGLHYWKDGEWVESKEVIDIVPGGALASQGPHQVGFAANINTVGAINMLTSDGKRLRSHVLGLAYTDARTGQSVMIADIKDSIGLLVGENQIFYNDAFDNANGVKADIRYTYTRSGIEQDIILRANPPGPEVYGLDPATTRLEVFTEFVEAPEPVLLESRVLERSDDQRRVGMVLPDFITQNLSFGDMRMEGGQAFPLTDQAEPDQGVPTGKTWEVRDGRTFLIEAVQFPSVKPQLDALPPPGQRDAKLIPKARPGRGFPAPPRQARRTDGTMKTAALPAKQKGFVIDYIMTSGVTNFTLAGDTTYYVGSSVYLWGTSVIEGGTVIKYTNGSVTAQLRFADALNCQTSPYRPAIATSMHDNTVGATISGSTGNPTNYCGIMICLGNSVPGYFNVHDIHVSHAYRAFLGTTTVSADINNCQVRHAHGAFQNVNGFWNLRNVLASDVYNTFIGYPPHTNTAEHVTFHSISNFVAVSVPSLPSVKLTNCLLIGVTNGVSYVGTGVETNLNAAGVFQTAGSGAFYLATNSPYRDAGTTNINPSLLSDLRQRTTYPPTIYSNTTTTINLTLAPCVWRDTDTPDLGYHYDTLDYFISGLTVTNASLFVTNGAAIGFDYSSGSWGVILKNAKLLSEGQPTNLNHLVRAHLVQEKSAGNPASRALFYDGASSGASNEMRMRFTFFAQSADDGYMLYTGQKFSALEWTHSAIYNPSLVVDTDTGNYITCGLTNSLWERGGGEFGMTNSAANSTVHVRNNLFKNFTQHFFGAESGWTVSDNLVDGGGLYDHGVAVTNRNNAYYLASTNLSGGTSNLTLTNLSYVVGLLGNYYQPTNSILLNGGSQNATNSGLYHFTCTTNQVKETNSVVDIGLHYVALNASGGPPDGDSDGLPDYYEDRNGNGSWDSGELNWQNADTDGDGVGNLVELLQGRNPLGGTIADTTNTLNLRVFTPLK